MSEPMVFRLAVSPTIGNHKLGPVRTHLYNYAYALHTKLRNSDTKIIYRVDDTNSARHARETIGINFSFFSNQFGLTFDLGPGSPGWAGPSGVLQSKRGEIYAKYLSQLDADGFILSDELGRKLFNVDAYIKKFGSKVSITDELRGEISVSLFDQIEDNEGRTLALTRSDGSILYHLATVVDDIEYGVTHVVKGNDKIVSTLYHHMLRVALGDTRYVTYLHTPLLLDDDDSGYGGMTPCDVLLEQGVVPEVLLSYALSSGYGEPDKLYFSLEEFAKKFDPRLVHKNDSRFDFQRVRSICNDHLRTVPPESYSEYLIKALKAMHAELELETIMGDSTLSEMIYSLRRTPAQSKEIINRIIRPHFDPPSPEVARNVQCLIDCSHLWLEDSTTCSNICIEKFPVDKKSFYDALRWLLVGTSKFPSIEAVHDYLVSRGVLQLRIDDAKVMLKQYAALAVD